MAQNTEEKAVSTTRRYRNVNLFWRILFVLSTVSGIAFVVYYVFHYNFAGVLFDIGARYLAMACFLPFVFIFFPFRKGLSPSKVPWYDILAAFLACAIPVYFFLHSWDIIFIGWNENPPTFEYILAIIFCLLVLESARRTGGKAYFLVCLTVGLFPLVADSMPGILHGRGYEWPSLIGAYTFGSSQGFPGMPGKIMAEILIGFLIFAGFLMASGAGSFFLNIASAIFGRFRGGPAKVAVVGSALFGSMSGSAISNVVGTGAMTIPAMKKIGFEPTYAGAIEACASTGGILMPPVMGAVAFVMAEMAGVQYAEIMLAAMVPSVLFYIGLLLQVDAYAGRVGMRGLPREEIPSFGKTLKEGWHFVIAFLFLFWGLLYMRWEAVTPFYASVVLFILSLARKDTRIGLRKMFSVVESMGRIITETMGVLLPIAFVIGGLTNTGVAPAFTSGLVSLAGGNPFLALLLGVLACYMLGTVGMVTPAYIFLAVSLVPALINMGFDVVASHLFVVYYAMLAGITPPVAIVAFVGANIAGAPGMKTAWRAMQLGIVIYFIPFFFIFNPALIFHGTIAEIIYSLAGCFVGITFLAAGVEGYLLGVGQPPKWARPLLIVGGLLLGFPEMTTDIIGAVLLVIAVSGALIAKRTKRRLGVQSVGSGR